MTDYGTVDCEILRYDVVKDDDELTNIDDPSPGHHYLYTVVVQHYVKGQLYDNIYHGIPRRAFKFWDNKMTMDFYLPNVFRHDIRIPDDIMPESWKNLKHHRREILLSSSSSSSSSSDGEGGEDKLSAAGTEEEETTDWIRFYIKCL